MSTGEVVMRFSVPVLVGVLLAGLFVGVTVGASTAPTIKVCVQSGGTMRYLASGVCKKGEKALLPVTPNANK